MNSSSVDNLLTIAKQHFRSGRAAEAESTCRQILLQSPKNSEALHLLGLAAFQSGRLDEAESLLRRAIAANPSAANYHSNLGTVLKSMDRAEDSVAAYRRAIALNPNLPEAHNNLGSVLATLDRLDEAAAACRKALSLQPNYPSAHFNLSNALFRLGRVEEAVAHVRRVLELEPSESATRSILISSLNYTSADFAQKRAEIQAWHDHHVRPLRGSIVPHPNDRNPDRRLRIGYVSPDFRQHSVAYFMEGLLARHDPNQVEVHAYSDSSPRPDAITARLQKLVPHWHDITGLADQQVAEMIRQDHIDILVDLTGHFAGNRLLVFARKPAPIQVTYLGYPDTTGLPAMDYRMTDAYADPPGMTEPHYTEKLLRLPRSFVCYTPPADAPQIAPPPALAKGHITFGSFNNLYKINSQLVGLWSQILRELPASRLLIKNVGLKHEIARRDLQGRFTAQGIDLSRIDLRRAVDDMQGHLKTYDQIDIVLDTYPYHGTTTTCEAMWMGVPVVTLAGQHHASRVGVSLLTNLKLTELIAQTPAEYVNIAAQLAQDLPRLTDLRAALRARFQNSPLMDAPGFARDVEAAYRAIWKQFCQTPDAPLRT